MERTNKPSETSRLFALALLVAVAFGASCAHSDARVTAVERGPR